MAKRKPKQFNNKSVKKQISQTIIFNIDKIIDLSVLQITVQNFCNNLSEIDNVIILNRTEQKFTESDFLGDTNDVENLKIFNSSSNSEIKDFINNDNIIYINSELLINEINYKDVEKAKDIKDDEVVCVNFSGASQEVMQSPILILKRKIVLDYLENYSYYVNLNQAISFLSNRNAVKITGLYFPKKQKVKTEKKKLFTKKKLILWYVWLISQPINEVFKVKKIAFGNNSGIYRITFIALTIISFFFISIGSFKAGISGDEPVNYHHAKFVYDYYARGDSAALNTPNTKLQYYGQSFDNLTYIVNKVFNIENYYESRHLLNAITGWLAMLFTAGIVIYLIGWRAGLITFLLILFSPRFLGHSWNNPKDIPFAFTYIFSIYFQIKIINELPKIKISTLILVALSIALSISVRIGGLLLIAYLFLFFGIYAVICHPFKNYENPLKKFVQTGFILAGACVAGYFLGLVFWPYALEDPIKNPIESLKIMTNFTAALRQTFMGEFIWSDKVPWNYVPVYIMITTPIIVFAGFMAFTFLIWKNYNTKKLTLIFFIAFTFIFPIFYIIYKNSNVYGGWRHVLFTYPTLVAISGIGINTFIDKFKNKWHPYLMLLILIFLGKPIYHTFKNHPYQYVYFNQFVGGIKGAFSDYEMDYYYHSLKGGTEWLLENEIKKDTSSNIIVATNHGELVSYYLRKQKKAKVTYVRYYDRGNTNWDYAVIANSYINPDQKKYHSWPPKNTIYTIDVDGMPVCAILKRNTKLDYYGYQKLKKRDFFGAIRDYTEALKIDKTNEVAYINLASAYMYTRQFEKAISTLQKLLEIYPKYDKGLNLLGLIYYNQKNYEDAYKVFNSIIDINPKFVNAYHNLGLVFLRMNKKNDALKYFQKAIQTNSKYKPSYLAIANILKESGREEDAKRYLEAANRIK